MNVNGAEKYDIVLTTNGRGMTLRLAIPRSVLKALCWLGFLLVNLAVCCAIDYSGLWTKRAEFKSVARENARLRGEYTRLETAYASRAAELGRVKSMIAKLKLITKAIHTDADVQQLNQATVADFAQDPEVGEVGDAAETGDAGEFDVAEREPAAVPRLAAPSPAATQEPDVLEPVFEGPLPQRLDLARQFADIHERELIAIWESLGDREALLASTPTIKPAQGYYSSRFGYRIHPVLGRALLHAGVDIAAPYGSIVRAPADGVVSYVGREGGYGNLVSIDHGFGITTRFAHNSRILVKLGQRVHRGDNISLVGSTGRSTGAHVHYEVRVRGIPVDPANYILQDN